MMNNNGRFLGVVAVVATAVLTACSGGYSGSEEDAFEGHDSFEGDSSQQQEALRRSGFTRWRRSGSPGTQDGGTSASSLTDSNQTDSTGAPSVDAAAGEVRSRVTADGESFDVVIPELAPTREMPAGGTCGVIEDGVVLVCQPGTFCLSPGEGVPGTCVAAPRAPRTNG